MTGNLSAADLAILEFAQRAPANPVVREEAIRKQLKISPMRYYQRLNALIDTPAARAKYPMLLGALERLRSS